MSKFQKDRDIEINFLKKNINYTSSSSLVLVLML